MGYLNNNQSLLLDAPQLRVETGPGGNSGAVPFSGPLFTYGNPACTRCGHNHADHWPAYAGDSCMDCGCLGFEG